MHLKFEMDVQFDRLLLLLVNLIRFDKLLLKLSLNIIIM